MKIGRITVVPLVELQRYLAAKRGRARVLARALEVSPALISMWASGVRRIPTERILKLTRLTGCRPTHLRPDVFRKGGL